MTLKIAELTTYWIRSRGAIPGGELVLAARTGQGLVLLAQGVAGLRDTVRFASHVHVLERALVGHGEVIGHRCLVTV